MAHLKLVVDNTNYTPTIIIRPYHKIITVDPEVNPYRKGSKRHENYRRHLQGLRIWAKDNALELLFH